MRKCRYELIPGSNPRTWTPVWYDEPVATVKKAKPAKPAKLKGKNWLLYTRANWPDALTSCKDFLRVKVYKKERMCYTLKDIDDKMFTLVDPSGQTVRTNMIWVNL